MATYLPDRSKPLVFTTPKDPSDVVAYGVNVSAEIAAGDSYSSHTVTVESGLTKDSDAHATGVISAVVSGGTAGTSYEVAYRLITTNGVDVTYTGLVKVANR